MIVDCTTVQIPKVHGNIAAYWSAKDGFCALSFEVAISIGATRIVSISKANPGGQHDIQIYRTGLKTRLLPGEVILADKGYRDNHDNTIWSPIWNPQTPEQLEFNRELSKIRARIEQINNYFKRYNCFSGVFRNSYETCELFFVVVGKLINLQLSLSPLYPE